ncbi:MAG TPA: diaminopimelate decarboxylase [Clostridiales bacterium]|nr:diaminopimelate decarboxylase [Clostridiales bacterium]
MFVSECLNVNEKGHLTIGGCDTVELANQFGTPLIVYNEETIRKNCREFVSSINEHYEGKGLVYYASKAFSCLEMCRICKSEGLGLDVVSGGELYTALKADFPPEKICFHGNNKTDSEICEALDAGVGRIIVDNIEELRKIGRTAAEKNKTAKVLLRIKPGIDAHTHEFIKTGQIDSKFGFALETGEAMEAVKLALAEENIELMGLHCHIGSQIFDIDPFILAAEVMIAFIAEIKKETGTELTELNLGGGFGIKYTGDDNPERFSEYMKKVALSLKATAEKYGIKTPFVMIEPGRSIVGAEAVTLYTVGSVKEIPNIRNYVSIDGGMTDNPRYILYGSKYDIHCANKMNEPRDYMATIAGRCCESGDLIQKDAMIQKTQEGDIIAVLSTGAYNYSMASNYNRVPRPAVVMITDGKPRLIIKRESYDDLIANDI